MNTSHISGLLGKDVEIRAQEDGSLIAEISVSVSDFDGYDEKGNPTFWTTWVQAVIDGPRVLRLQDKLLRGRKVHIQGALRTRKYKVSEEKTMPLTYIRVERIEIEPAYMAAAKEGQ